MRVKPVRVRDHQEVVYSQEHWRLLEALRSRAKPLMALLRDSLLVGSVARGDVHKSSDVDVALLDPQSPSVIEEKLASRGFRVAYRELIQATPSHAPKLYIYLEGGEKVSIPLSRLSRIEEEFYRFAGSVNLVQLEKGGRVPGVNKKLRAVLPKAWGHVEIPVIDNEDEVAGLLGVSIETVRDRVEALSRRAERGRTGLFLKVVIPAWDSPEEAVARIARRVPALKSKVDEWIG